MKLTAEQTRMITIKLEEKGIHYSPLKEELTDDLATAIEQRMSEQVPFAIAMDSIMRSVDAGHLRKVQRKVLRTVFFNKRINRYEQKNALYLAGALALWVTVEFLIGKLTGVLELGPLYGSLSTLLIVIFLIKGLKHIRQNIQGSIPNFSSIVWSGSRIILASTVMFGLFLVFFWTYIHPTFYSEFRAELDPDITSFELLYRSVVGMCTACLIIGLITTVLIGTFSKTSKITT